jgi:hypothetical protein
LPSPVTNLGRQGTEAWLSGWIFRGSRIRSEPNPGTKGVFTLLEGRGF